jgi:AIPR protein
VSLRQQIVQDRIDETAKVLGLADRDRAFLRLAHLIITAQSIHAFNEADLVDGGQDKQIDAITIEEGDDEEATVYIIQAKNTESFSSNALIQMRNGLHWIFDKTKADLQGLGNAKFRDKVLEYRSVQSGFGPSNIRIVVAFVTNGHTSALSDEFKQEAKTIREEYDNGTFEKFDLLILGSDELVEQINAAEKKNKKINADIKIRYDANSPSLIKYHSQGLKGVVCSAPAREIARIVNADPSGFVFDSNIRRFLGGRGAVNTDIRNTCTSSESSHLFWFLNNGITIACVSFDPVTDPDNPHVKIRNFQIVNGCQTATTLAQAMLDKKLEADVFVLLRVYEAPDNTLVDRIVLTTNNQNKISSRDLRANDRVQVEMQQRFEKFKLHYERKFRQFDKAPGVDASRIAPNELVAQSYLAVVLKKPSDARRRKYKVWSDLYDKIFSAQAIEPYVISFLLYRLAVQWLRSSGNTSSPNDITRRLANNGAFHVARIASFHWRSGDDWSGKGGAFLEQIDTLEKTPQKLVSFFADALKTFTAIVSGNPQYASDIDGAMKSNNLDADIDRHLYLSNTPGRATSCAGN